jgi:hypothetical protein
MCSVSRECVLDGKLDAASTTKEKRERRTLIKYHNPMKRFILAFAIFWFATNLACTTADRIVGADGDNNNDQGKKPGWNPKDDHPCTVERISMKDFLKSYGKQGGLPPLFPRPLVITKADVGRNSKEDPKSSRNSKFQNLTRADSILHSFPANFTVTLSSSNSFSEHRRTIPFANYLEDVNTGPALEADIKSNETWYLFGETYSTEWKNLLEAYELPPCQACNDMFDESLVALSFGIGNSGSGVQWHVHGPGFSEAIHGRKHWILYSFDNEPSFHPDQTSLNWMHYNYSAFEKSEDMPLECTLHPGDIIYL